MRLAELAIGRRGEGIRWDLGHGVELARRTDRRRRVYTISWLRVGSLGIARLGSEPAPEGGVP